MADDIRLTSGICTPRQVSSIVGVNQGTLRSWMQANSRRSALVRSAANAHRGWPTIPLVGLVEAHVVHVLRSQIGLKMRKVADYAAYLRAQDPFAMASPELVTDSIDLYFANAEGLERVHDGQQPLHTVVEPFLRRISLWSDGQPGVFIPEQMEDVGVTIDPRFSAGRMTFRNRVPLFAVAGALRAGDDVALIAEDFGLSEREVLSVDENIDWIESAA